MFIAIFYNMDPGLFDCSLILHELDPRVSLSRSQRSSSAAPPTPNAAIARSARYRFRSPCNLDFACWFSEEIFSTSS
jgi:hypothetical protein